MKKSLIFLIIIFLFKSSIFPQIPETKKDADPFKDLERAKATAAKEGKRVLIIVGGDWCDWCQKFDNFINKDEELALIVNKNFVVIKVYCKNDLTPNGLFLAKFPTPSEFPFIYVLNSEGTIFEAKATSSLEEGQSYNKKKVKDFLLKYVTKK